MTDLKTDPDRPSNNPLRIRKSDLPNTEVPDVRKQESAQYKRLNHVPDKAKVMSLRRVKDKWWEKPVKAVIGTVGRVLTPKSKVINVVGILRQIFFPYDVYALDKDGKMATEVSGTPIVDVRATVIAKVTSFVLASLGAYLATRFLGEKGIELFERLLTLLEKVI